MPSFNNFGTVRASAVQQVVQTHTISGDIIDDATGVTKASFQGASALSYPSCLSELPVATQDDIVAGIAQQILLAKAGL
jgi:hypothetical protein